MLVHPSREVRCDCSKPKGNTCIQVVFTQSPVSLTTTSEYLPVSGILDPLCICTRFHTQLHQSKERKSYLTCLRHYKTVQTPVKNMKTNSQQSFLFRFKYSSKQFPLPTQFRSFPMTHYMSQSNALTTAVQTNILGYLMHLTNQTNFPKQANTAHSVVNSQPQHQVPLCLQCHDGSYLSLSQHSSTYTARQTPMLQAPISRSPVSANIRQAPLLLHTTEPQVFNYSRITLHMWQLNQGH